MKIGEYFIKNNYITQETLDEALKLQKHYKDLRIGEVLVIMGEISERNMITYVTNYIEAHAGDTKNCLIQKEIDVLTIGFNDSKKKNKDAYSKTL